MPVKCMYNVFKTIVEPAIMHGSEYCAMAKKYVGKLNSAETRLVRLAGVMMRMDYIRNYNIRNYLKLVEAFFVHKLLWFRHCREIAFAIFFHKTLLLIAQTCRNCLVNTYKPIVQNHLFQVFR